MSIIIPLLIYPCHCPQDGKTALWNASFNGHVQVADLLLKANASVNTPEYRVSEILCLCEEERGWLCYGMLHSLSYLLPNSLVFAKRRYERCTQYLVHVRIAHLER